MGHRLVGTQRPQMLWLTAWVWLSLTAELVRRETGHTHPHTRQEQHAPRLEQRATRQEQHHTRPHEEPPPSLYKDRKWRGDGAYHHRACGLFLTQAHPS